MKALLALLLWPLVGLADLTFPDDPRAITAWAMYSNSGNCKTIPNCIDGFSTRQAKRVWIPIYVEDLGLPADTTGVYLDALLNVTHPQADTSTCYLQIMAASDSGLPNIPGRADRQWLFRVMSHETSQRVTQSAWVRVQDGRFWLKYHYRGDGLSKAGHCSYGAQLSVGAWQ